MTKQKKIKISDEDLLLEETMIREEVSPIQTLLKNGNIVDAIQTYLQEKEDYLDLWIKNFYILMLHKIDLNQSIENYLKLGEALLKVIPIEVFDKELNDLFSQEKYIKDYLKNLLKSKPDEMKRMDMQLKQLMVSALKKKQKQNSLPPIEEGEIISITDTEDFIMENGEEFVG